MNRGTGLYIKRLFTFVNNNRKSRLRLTTSSIKYNKDKHFLYVVSIKFMLEKTNLRITLTQWAIDIKVHGNNCVEECHFSFFCLVYWNNWMQLDKFLNWFHHFTELWTVYLPGRLLCKVKLKTRGRGKFLKKLWCCVGGGDLKRQL